MPLNLTNAQDPPTLGRRKNKEEIKRALQKKYDIRAGLRDQGGYTDIFNDWDRKRRREYASVIASQEAKETAQFGPIPDDWSYFSYEEANDVVRAAARDSNYSRGVGIQPSVRVDLQPNQMIYEILLSASADDEIVYSRVAVSEEQLVENTNSAQDYLTYTINYAIKQLAKKLEEDGVWSG